MQRANELFSHVPGTSSYLRCPVFPVPDLTLTLCAPSLEWFRAWCFWPWTTHPNTIVMKRHYFHHRSVLQHLPFHMDPLPRRASLTSPNITQAESSSTEDTCYGDIPNIDPAWLPFSSTLCRRERVASSGKSETVAQVRWSRPTGTVHCTCRVLGPHTE